MPPVIWTEEADADLDHITAYIGQHDAAVAIRLWQSIVDSVIHLPEHSYMFKASERIPGCREIGSLCIRITSWCTPRWPGRRRSASRAARTATISLIDELNPECLA
jgi:plasmid stabilization system protein ParE